jgi:ABC-2 type transport system permease protein
VSAPSNVAPDAPVEPQAAARETRPLYWSVRREMWENRSITVAPIAASALVLFGTSISALGLPGRMRALELDASRQHAVVVLPYSMAASLIIITTYLVGVFYCLDALHGERRDRSILFWKSLPVSDATTVLSKACIPLVVLPLIAFAVSLATQLVMLAWSTFVLAASGVGAAGLWTRLPLLQMTFIMIYGLTVHALWHAPIYAWLLLVSVWARRSPLLWAVLPLLATGALEGIVFHTSLFGSFLKHRLVGAMAVAFSMEGQGDVSRFTQITPLRFLISPGLWLGLVAAAALLAAAAWLRRNREPI